MRADDLVFWLDQLPDSAEANGGALCRRHADSMVVPRGWTLDDLRDPELHLFRPPQPLPPPARGQRPRAVARRHAPMVGQLELGSDAPDAGHADVARDAPAEEIDDDVDVHVDTDVDGDGEADVAPWTPEFDEADDLDGLLAARSPLLSRAFRTADRAGR